MLFSIDFDSVRGAGKYSNTQIWYFLDAWLFEPLQWHIPSVRQAEDVKALTVQLSVTVGIWDLIVGVEFRNVEAIIGVPCYPFRNFPWIKTTHGYKQYKN